MADYIIRPTSFDDVKSINSLIAASGGIPFFKASYGQFNISQLLESCLINLVASQKNDKDKINIFFSISDMPMPNCGFEFDFIIETLQDKITGLTVSV